MPAISQHSETSKRHHIWISHYIRCLSFHEEADFEQIEFGDSEIMWDQVFQYLERGYRVC